ncbi:MAG: sodium:alanine symporter family protein [Bacteroides sp.]|nr:sodium:alanine symporter family protein [Bacteroides sp.]
MPQEKLLELIGSFNQTYVGPLLAILLLGTGLYYTVRLGFIQQFLWVALKRIFSRRDNTKASRSQGMTSFQALSTSIASQVGTGNIVGVSTALIAGGPGALFWLWISSMVGMSTNFAEAVLGQLYKTQKDGHAIGGPAYYIRNGVGSPFLAGVFAVFSVVALGLMGTLVQSNSIVDAASSILPQGVNKIYIGLGLSALVMLVLAGGVTRIASFAERVVPVMAGIFFLVSLVFIVLHAERLPQVVADVFAYAFTPWAPAGGVLGATVMSTIRYGVSRGLFSNEAGLGSTPHAHAIAQVKNPYDQGLVALTGIAVDIVVCTLTALVVLLSGVIETHPELQGVAIPQLAFSNTFGYGGTLFFAVALLFFAFTTIIGWYFFAAQNVRYLFGERLIWPFRIVVGTMVVLAAVLQVNLVWELADTCNFFLVIPNLVALIFLSPKVVEQARLLRRDVRGKR